ncbi:MAG TPA: response regulator [Gemmataceae bacterium]|nr:response regulator [Gemmataceae bacterium]
MAEDETTKILVVDDLPEKLLVYQTILGELGQALVTARSGEEALREVLRHDFAVILLDVQMPGGMSGLETAALIRKRKRSAHTPIIFLTAFADEVRAVEGYAHGAVDYILTPVVPEILRAKVRVFVDLHRMAQQIRCQAEERVALAEERSMRAAAEEATRRASFLADVSRALADSLDPDTTAKTLVHQVVPFLADLAGVTLIGEPGQPWRTKLAWIYPGDTAPTARWVASADAPRDELRAAVERVLARGTPEYPDDLDIPYPDSAEHTPPADGRIRSAAVVPLRARDRTLGVLTLAFGPSGRRHEPADIALAGDLASRAAIALDNARLYKEVENADRQKNEFLSMLAHELRNPLAPIRNAAEVLRLAVPEHPRLQWAREVIDRQLTHLVRLVDDLLDVSRITRGKIRLQKEIVDLREVVRLAVEASRPLIEAHGHQLEVSAPSEPVILDGDPARLTQILTNLLNNAAKYTEESGRIWLTVSAECGAESAELKNEEDFDGPSPHSALCTLPCELVEIRVRDTGIGIPPEMLSAIFDLFTQADRSLDRSQGGLGVGLTLVKRLVELHGGTVEARSEGAGKGSEFIVRLPVMSSASAPNTAPDAQSAPRCVSVLLVDDNVDGAESLATLLRLAGHDVRLAHTGPDAVEMAAASRPDAVLLDIGLPGLDGYEVARRLRAGSATRNAVLVAVTGYGRDEDRQLSRAAGFDHHLVKPVDLATLQRILAPAADANSASNGAHG